MQNLKILYFQSDLAWENPNENIKRFEKKIKENINGHHLIVLPETFTTGFPVDPEPFAQSINGDIVSWMKKTAKETGAVLTGSFLLKEKNNYYNSMLWVTPDGNFDKYNKRHVFSMGGEDKKITKGKNLITVELNGWRIRPMICYDLRFPVWSKNTINKKGNYEYDLAIYVANWPSQRSYPWNMLLVARAIENQSFVLGVNRIGYDGLGNYYSGNSKMIDAKGKIVSEAVCGKETAETVVINKEDLNEFRNKFNVGNDWDIFEIKL
jgi:predicted amidohydrolase